MSKLLTTVTVMAALMSAAHAEETSLLPSLPGKVQKSVAEIRAACREAGIGDKVTSNDLGLETFALHGVHAVLIDPVRLCGGECIAGVNCSNRGTRGVELYIRKQNSWAKAPLAENITGDIFISFMPDAFKGDPLWPDWPELNALVVDLFGGNRDCPVPPAVSNARRESRSCIARWNGATFTYRPL